MIEIIDTNDDDVVTPENIGGMLRIERCKRGMTQITLARKADLSFAAVSQIESGRHSPTFKSVCLMLETMGLELVMRERRS